MIFQIIFQRPKPVLVKYLHLYIIFARWRFTVAVIPSCAFEDTVNITGSTRFENGSVLHDNVLIPSSLVGVYAYEEIFDGVQEPVAPHIRGCICKLMPCVKFCCHPTELRVEETRECTSEFDDELDFSPYVNVTQNDGSVRSVHVLDDFVVQQGVPCADGMTLAPEDDPIYSWKLFENGTLLRLYDSKYMSRRDYCLTPHLIEDTYILNPVNCPVSKPTTHKQLINMIAMSISVPFLILTILVYIFVPGLQNLHGKCLICYLLSLAIAYSLFIVHSFVDIELSNEVCTFIGFGNYYCFLAAFMWLTVISFDLWNSFCGSLVDMVHLSRRKRFFIYSIYAWACPLLLTALTFFAEKLNIDESLKPGIGELYCWFKSHDWSAMIYFYGPILLLMLFNLVMFVLTARRIFLIKKECRNVVSNNENIRQFKTYREDFGLVLRLFIVMGVTWLLEGLSYMAGSENNWSMLFHIPDFCNAAQGIIIFIVLVLRPKLWIRIRNRDGVPSETDSAIINLEHEEIPLN